jgi:protein TonB
VGDAPVEDLIKTKLGSAQIAYLSGRLIDPRGDNALDYYKAVLALQPENAEAKTGMQKVIDTLEQRVVKSLQERNAARVVKAWTALQRAAPNHPRLDALRTQLLALSRTTPKSQASAPASATVVASAPSPAVENDQAERELAEAIAREMAEQEAAAAAPVEQVADAPAPPEPTVNEEVAAVADAPIPDEPDVTETVAQAARLKRVREVPPVYPREAQRAGTEGWVQVEFTIAPDGTTQDLKVRDSAPKLIFDDAALDSVSKWRFEPIRKNGAPVAQRAVLQVRFVLGT